MNQILNKFKFKSEFFLLLKRNPAFYKLFIANILSKVGTQMHRFGLPWIVYDITGSAQLMAVNFTISLIPGFIFGFIGGSLADKYSRRNILIIGDIFAAIFTFVIILLHFSSLDLKVEYLFFLTFILSAINSLYQPAFQAGMSNLLEKDDIITANGLFSVTQSFISLGGPVIAGFIIGIVGPWINIIINGLSFLISAILILYINSKGFAVTQNNNKKPSFFSDIRICLDIIKKTNWLLYGLLLTFGVYLGSGSVGSLIQYYLRETLHLEGASFGISFALFEFIPMLLMGYYAPMLGKKYQMEKLVLFGSLFYSISLIGIGLTTIYPIVILSGMLLNGAAVLILVNWNTMVQQRIPNEVLGRVSGVALTIQSLALPIGGGISSYLVTMISPQYVMIGFGLITALFVLFTFYMPFTSTNMQDQHKKVSSL